MVELPGCGWAWVVGGWHALCLWVVAVDAGIDVISQTSRAKKRRKRPNKPQKSADTKYAKSEEALPGGYIYERCFRGETAKT